MSEPTDQHTGAGPADQEHHEPRHPRRQAADGQPLLLCTPGVHPAPRRLAGTEGPRSQARSRVRAVLPQPAGRHTAQIPRQV